MHRGAGSVGVAQVLALLGKREADLDLGIVGQALVGLGGLKRAFICLAIDENLLGEHATTYEDVHDSCGGATKRGVPLLLRCGLEVNPRLRVARLLKEAQQNHHRLLQVRVVFDKVVLCHLLCTSLRVSSAAQTRAENQLCCPRRRFRVASCTSVWDVPSLAYLRGAIRTLQTHPMVSAWSVG